MAVYSYSDTRVTGSDGFLFEEQLAKQRFLAANLVLAYTSSNVYVTTAALDAAEGAPTTSGPNSFATERDVRRIGRFLQEWHEKKGGCAELIAALWKQGYPYPEILEVTPPEYEPRSRDGIIGIGDRAVLERCRGAFRNPPPKILETLKSNELMRLLKGAPPGHRFVPMQPRPLYAAIEISCALMDALDEGLSQTVGYPLQISKLSAEKIVNVNVVTRKEVKKWLAVTADKHSLAIRTNPPTRGERFAGKLRAFQIAD